MTLSGPLVGVVGPCGAGKSTLVHALRACGVNAKEIAQEHSYVQAMWQRFTAPDLLIYLDVSRESAGQRKGRELAAAFWERQMDRLAHAREHADFLLETDALAPEEVLAQVLSFLEVLR